MVCPPFKPAEDYKGLLIQARALNRLAGGAKAAMAYYADKYHSVSDRRVAELESALESEKEMNDILTREIEELRNENV